MGCCSHRTLGVVIGGLIMLVNIILVIVGGYEIGINEKLYFKNAEEFDKATAVFALIAALLMAILSARLIHAVIKENQLSIILWLIPAAAQLAYIFVSFVFATTRDENELEICVTFFGMLLYAFAWTAIFYIWKDIRDRSNST